MSKPLIVIADMDTAYLAELENKFLVELGDRAELEIISDPEYFEQFFSNPCLLYTSFLLITRISQFWEFSG